MDNLDETNIRNIKEVCRTCLTNDEPFFNISDIFDTSTLAQMLQNITNLQMKPLDGYTQSICFQCVKELRRANQFRIKCLESNNTLMNIDIKIVEVPIAVCKIELPKNEKIKPEIGENTSKCFSDTEYDCKSDIPDVESDNDNEEDCIKSKKRCDKNNRKNPTIIFDCPLCHGLFSSNIIYQKHINEYHSNRRQDECFNNKREPLGHIFKRKYLNKIKLVYKCVLDEFSGNTFVEFKNHMKEHTGEKPVVCVECGFRTKEIHLLQAHRLQKHVEEKKFSCSLCNYTCQKKNILKNHSATHTTEKNFKCKLCPMTFKQGSTLSDHKKVKHENRKSHVCSICEKAYFHKKGLRYHMRTHTGERPHICHYCGFRCASAENLESHIKLQHEPIKTMFKCDQCSYSAKTKSLLNIHILRHKGDKCFKCPQCPFSAVVKYSLKQHIKLHSGLKKFKCDLCDYKCMKPFELKVHRRVHTGEKPFSCTICNYSGSTQSFLNIHIQTHSSEQKFQCPNCPFKTNVRDYLTRHKKNKCVIKKRGRPPSKLSNIQDNTLINDEIKENTEEYLTNNIV